MDKCGQINHSRRAQEKNHMEQSQERERIKKEEIIIESMNIRELQKKAVYKMNYELSKSKRGFMEVSRQVKMSFCLY